MATIPTLPAAAAVTANDLFIVQDYETGFTSRTTPDAVKAYVVNEIIADGDITASNVSATGATTVQAELNKSVKTVATFAALSSTTASIGQQVSVPGVGLFDVVAVGSHTAKPGLVAVNGSIAFVRTNYLEVSPYTMGATGNGITNDTVDFQETVTNWPKTSLVSGTYKIAQTGTGYNGYSIALENDRIISGEGGEVNFAGMGYYALASYSKSDIWIDRLKITASGHVGNDSASTAVWFSAESADVWNLCLSFSSIVDSSWGALLRNELGTTSFAYNVRFIGNDVHSTVPNTMADGLHIVGRIKGAVLSANTVQNRGDAGLAVNSSAGNDIYGVAVTGNASVNNLVGVDVSGASYCTVVGNACYSVIDHSGSNPALRAITYSGRVPQNVTFSSNIAIGNHTTSGEVDVKVTSAGAAVYAHVCDNQLKTFYTDASHVSLADNYFVGNGTASFDNNSGNIHIGTNTWAAEMDISGPGNPGLAGNVTLKKQNWTRWNAANFLPLYSSANPFWDGKWFLDSDVRLVSNESFATSSAVPVDVPNAVIYLRFPCILDAIIGVADCATHSGHLSLTTMANVEVARIDFPVTPGGGGVNVTSSGFTFPLSAGNPYKPKLAAGVYKIRAYSDSNALTVKTISVAVWD